MPWIKLSVDATGEAVDWISTLLSEIGFTGERVLGSALPEQAVSLDDPANLAFTVQLYVPETAIDQARTIRDRLSSLERTGMISAVRMAEVAEKTAGQYAFSWQVGSFVVLSPDAPLPSLNAEVIPLRLPPTLAFGSGLHPATWLNLQLLEQYVQPGMQTLDLGCGSGILSVAMAKLGAHVLALDNDPIAVQATAETAALNEVGDRVTVIQGSLGKGSELGHWMGNPLTESPATISPAANLDLITANLLGRIHLELAQDFRDALQHAQRPGILIASGFTVDYTSQLQEAFQPIGFQFKTQIQSGEWIGLVFQTC